MLKKNLFKILVTILIVTILQSSMGQLFYVLAEDGEGNNTEPEVHNYFTEITLRKDSEYGEIVADLLSGNVANLNMDEDYYLCISAKTPEGNATGDDGKFSIQLGDGKPNGFAFINIPGQRYSPGEIDSDIFSELISFEQYPDATYGSGNSAYSLIDGKLTYKIKDAKMNNNNIYMAFGVKLDPIYWCNIKDILNAITFDISNENGVQDSYSLNVHVNNDKNYYISCTDNGSQTLNANARVETIAQAVNFGLQSTNESPLLYEKIGFTVTYPKNSSLEGISFSTVDMNSVKNSSYGIIEIGDEIDNGDGTLSKVVTIGPGMKGKSGASTFFAIWMSFNDKNKNDAIKDVVLSDLNYIPQGSIEQNELLFNRQSSTWTIKYKISNTPEIVDKTILTAINRIEGSNNSIYNWNIGRDEDDLLTAPQMLNGAYIKNDDSVETYYEKTVKANYNITNENVMINVITIPVGRENEQWKSSILLKYSGYDENNQLVSGEKVINGKLIKGASNNTTYYAVVKAKELGLKGFKSVEADIGKLGPGQVTSTWTSYNDFGSNLFAAYGYCTDSSIGNRVKCTYEIVNTSDSAPVNDLKVTSLCDIAGVAKASFSNNFTSGFNKDNSSIVAGNSMTLTNKEAYVYANISSSNGNTSILANPVVILKLPKGMNFSNLSFTKYIEHRIYGEKAENIPLDYQVDNISYLNTTEDGTNLYKITFNDKNLVLGEMGNDDCDRIRLRMTITFGTAKNVTTQVYDLNDLINFTSESNFIALQYPSNTNKVEDIYGVNNGNALGGSRRDDATMKGISVQRLDSITVDNAISIKEIDGIEVDEATRTWDTYDESNRNSISYIGLNTKGEFRLRIENPSTSVANGLKMIIPIPKEGVDLGTSFTKGENKFNMIMTPKDIGNYTYKYVKINEPVATNTYYKDMDVTENVSASEANAILIEKAVVGANEKSTLYFDFVVTNDESVSTGDFNCWRNHFEYILDNFEQIGSGSYVAAEVATCKITGTIFDDVNGNGKKDDEENVIPNVSVVATDSLGRVQFAQTDENGTYLFENVREDDISISMEIKEGAYIFNGTPAENGDEIYNNVTPETNKKKSLANIHAKGEEAVVNASVNKVFTITYDKGVGTGTAPAKQDYLENQTAIVSTPPSGMIQAGSDFVGWTTEKLATSDDNINKVEYRAGDVITVTKDMTLYAAYVKKELKIFYDYKGGGVYKEENGQLVNVSPEFKYVTYGARYDAQDKLGNKTLPAPTREGWKFIRWELPTSTYGSGNGIGNGTTVNIDEDTTIRAVWYKLRSDNVTVEDNLLNTTTLDEPLVCVKDDVYVINMNTNYGYKFELAEGTQLPEGIQFDAETGSFYGTPTVPYENEINVKVSVKYDKNNPYYYDFPYTVNLKLNANKISLKNEIDPQGYIALKNGNGTIALKTTVTGLKKGYNPNESNKVTFKATAEDNSVIEIGEAVIDENGVATIDWEVTEDEVGKYRIETEIKDLKSYYEVNSNNIIESYIISLQELAKYNITFDPNGYDFEEEVRVYAEGTQLGQLPSPKVEGYTFKGWFEGKTDDTKQAQSSDEITGEKTLYACFEKKRYVVNYDSKIETQVESLEDIDFKQSNLIPTTELSKTGYTLTGWSLENGSIIKDTTKFSDLVNSDDVLEITLHANWEANQYFITYDANGGSCGASVKRVYFDEKIGDLEKPSKTGYDFVGWYKVETGNSEEITKDKVYNYTNDITIVALWTPKTGYKIYYNTNGGSEISANTTANWETVALEGIQNPTKDGNKFLNWTYTGKEVSETETYGDLAKNDKNESITLNAVWEPNKYSVTLEQGTGYTVINSDRIEESTHGSNYIFEVRFDPGYEKGKNFKVTVNDQEVQLNDKNKYTITNITENKVVKVYDVIDARRAEGQIVVSDDKWTTKDTDIKYDINHKEAVDVVISGTYNYETKPSPKIEYAIVKDSDEYVAENTLTWKPYTASFSIYDDGKYIVYAKLTAENGAITYVNTNGFTVDMTVPVIHTLEEGKRYCSQQTIEITDATSGIESVKVNEEVVKPNSDGTYTLPTVGQAMILVKDKAGNYAERNVELNPDHTYNLKDRIAPTCTEDGKEVYKCVICGFEKEDKLEKLGHDWGEWHRTLEPTEETRGKDERECSRCDTIDERSVDVLQHTHNYSEEWTIDVEPTCTTNGEKSHYCKCGSRADITEILANGHSWGDWHTVVEPTEESAGKEERECDNCDAIQENVLAPLNHTHNYDSEFTVDVEPTCIKMGEKSRHCTCGSRIDITEIEALGHTWGNWEVKVPATINNTGLEVRECSVCHEEQENIIPKINHVHDYSKEWTIDVEPTCIKDGEKSHHCDCGDRNEITAIEKLGHDFGDWEVTVEPTEEKEGLKVRKCSRCDEKEEEVLPKLKHVHDYSKEWTVDKKPTCTEKGEKSRYCECGERTDVTSIDALGHDFEVVGNKKVCKICGIEIVVENEKNDETNKDDISKDNEDNNQEDIEQVQTGDEIFKAIIILIVASVLLFVTGKKKNF